jgi:serine/threonine protein kinase
LDDGDGLSSGSPLLATGGGLPVGHQIKEFVIEGVVGEGGFSIVYRARDMQLGRLVAIKEYMPQSLAGRQAGMSVAPRSHRHQETFELGLRSFVNEARLLASFDHPALVKVYRFWEENGTAYMVMPLYQGLTMRAWLAQHRQRPPEPWLRALLGPLLDALELIHRDHCYHRDIAPDNVLLLSDGGEPNADGDGSLRPLLLDFGAARRVIGDADQALTVILKPGYAPIEQYTASGDLRQGPWTDIYALCALLYGAVAGRVPVPAVSRLVHDSLVPASQLGEGFYSRGFLQAIDAGLMVQPDKRPPSVAAFRALLQRDDRPDREPAGPTSEDSQATVLMPAARTSAPTEKHLKSAPPQRAPMHAAQADAVGAKSPAVTTTVVAVLAAAAVGSALWWALWPSSPPALQTPASTAAAPAQAPAPPPIAAPLSTPVTAPTLPLPFTVMNALQDIVAGADASMAFEAYASPSQLRIDVDNLQFRLRSPRAGYVYVFTGGTPKTQLYRLFPNAIDGDNFIRADQAMVLPRQSWFMKAAGPEGANHLAVVVSEHPLDFSNSGLQTKGVDLPVYDERRAKALWAERTTGRSPFLGKPKCPDAAACSSSYGARMLEITEVLTAKPQAPAAAPTAPPSRN